MRCLFILNLFFAFAVHATETSPPPNACALIKKQEILLGKDMDDYSAFQIDSEKYDARTKLIKDFGETSRIANPLILDPKVAQETLSCLTELLAKADPFDYECVMLKEMKTPLLKHLSQVKTEASALLDHKKITQKEYDSLMKSLTFLENGEE